MEIAEERQTGQGAVLQIQETAQQPIAYSTGRQVCNILDVRIHFRIMLLVRLTISVRSRKHSNKFLIYFVTNCFRIQYLWQF